MKTLVVSLGTIGLKVSSDCSQYYIKLSSVSDVDSTIYSVSFVRLLIQYELILSITQDVSVNAIVIIGTKNKIFVIVFLFIVIWLYLSFNMIVYYLQS